MPIVMNAVGRANNIGIQDTFNSTSWHIVASDGSGYTTAAALLAAGKVPFPNLPVGSSDCEVLVKSLATGGITPGSPFYININPPGGTPTDAISDEIGGLDQTLVYGPGVIYTIWVRKTVASDLIQLNVKY